MRCGFCRMEKIAVGLCRKLPLDIIEHKFYNADTNKSSTRTDQKQKGIAYRQHTYQGGYYALLIQKRY